MKTFDINMFLLESERLKEQIRDMENKIQTAKGELEKDTADYDNMKTEYEAVEERDGTD